MTARKPTTATPPTPPPVTFRVGPATVTLPADVAAKLNAAAADVAAKVAAAAAARLTGRAR